VTYEIRLVKRSEPVMKGAIAKYTPVELHAFLICEAGEFLPTAVCKRVALDFGTASWAFFLQAGVLVMYRLWRGVPS
jgi:hypothetical protein